MTRLSELRSRIQNMSTAGGTMDKFGVHHYVPGLIVYDPASDCGPQTTSITKTAVDGSGLSVTVSAGATSAVVTTPSGQTYTVRWDHLSGSGLSKDANGNEITINTSGQFFDTLNATTPVLTVAGSGTQASPLTFTYIAPSGANAVYTMKFTNKTVRTYFRCSTPSSRSSQSSRSNRSSLSSRSNRCYPSGPSNRGRSSP